MLMIFMHKRFCANIAGPLLLLLVFGTVTARAADTYWQLDPPAVGDWFDSDNWTDVVPSSSRDAHITNGGAAQIAAPGATAMNLFIGGEEGSFANITGGGTLTITGSQSHWADSWGLRIGHEGTGALNIENGGQVSNPSAYLGYEAGSEGAATVIGSGSHWTNSEALYVGYCGDGTVTVSDGGAITAQTLYSSLEDLSGDGFIAATGAVIDGDLLFDATLGTPYTFDFGSGGTLQLDANGTGPLGAGYTDAGALTITDGITVSSQSGYIGYLTGASGTATVTGSGSTWHNADSLYVGKDGTGQLNVADGALVTAETLYTSIEDLSGDGTIEAAGGVFDADITFTPDSGLTNTLAFGASGELILDVNGHSPLGVGYKRNGSMSIAEGLEIECTLSHLGYHEGSEGRATVTGANTSWTISDELFVGKDGSGELLVTDGASLETSSYVYLAKGLDSTGSVTVGGPGSVWRNGDSSILAGRNGSGTINIINGAEIHSESTVGIGFSFAEPKAQGYATVEGDGSVMSVEEDLWVGKTASGELTVTDGGSVVVDANVSVGAYYGAGTVSIRGSGSELIIGTDIGIGTGTNDFAEPGTGTLTVKDGGLLCNTGAVVGDSPDWEANVEVTGAGARWSTTDRVFIKSGSVRVTDAASVEIGETLKLWHTATVNLTGGTIRAGEVDHQYGGEFNFTGGTLQTESFLGDLVNVGGTLSPGFSPGTCVVEGDYTQDPDARLLMEIAGLLAGDEYDVLTVTGQMSLAGTLEVVLLEGFLPEYGDSFGLLSFGGLNGEYDQIIVPELPEALYWDTSELYSNGTVAVVPEAATLAILAECGLGLLLRRRRGS